VIVAHCARPIVYLLNCAIEGLFGFILYCLYYTRRCSLFDHFLTHSLILFPQFFILIHNTHDCTSGV